jgi:hypothetical protein
MKQSSKSSSCRRPWHSNRSKHLKPSSRLLKHNYPDRVTRDESQVSVGGLLALDQVLRILGHV